MLDTNEVNRLFDLLRELHGKNKSRDKRTVAIWAEVLKPWDYREVRAVAIARARVNRYYPDPAELACLLPPPADPQAAKEVERIKRRLEKKDDLKNTDRLKKDMESMDRFLAQYGT